MATIDDVKAALQALTDAIANLEVPAAGTIDEVDVVESDGTTEKFTKSA